MIVGIENRGGNTNVRFNQKETFERIFKRLEASEIYISRARTVRFADQKASGLTVRQWCEQNNLPEGINTAANFQGKEGDLASTVEGITMHVNATQGQ